MFPEVSASDIPTVDTRQMIEVDRAMIKDFYIELIQMMENAGAENICKSIHFTSTPETDEKDTHC